jgi:hypothetical protein
MRANAGIAWGYSGSILLVVHAPMVPASADWSEFMAEVRTHAGIRGVVIFANNSRLTPLQRAEIQSWYEEHKVRGALVTDSVMMRGIVTAMNWFGVDMRAFSPDNTDDAMDFVKVPVSGKAEALLLLRKLENAVSKKAALTTSSLREG